MERVKQGEQKAFRLLFDQYKGPIMSYLYHMVRNPKLAEDLTQETFFKVYRFRDKYEPQSKFTAWLWTIARNTALDHFRGEKDLNTVASNEEVLDTIVDSAPGSEAQLIESADRERVNHCIAGLTTAQRDALLLRTMSELSYDEIAAQMKLSLSSIKSLINRAKAGLMRCIGGAEASYE